MCQYVADSVNGSIEGLLELENLFLEENVIQLLAYDAVSKSRRVKVFFDGKEPACRSFFIHDSRIDWGSGANNHLFIAPFKSAEDNDRLKKSGQIMLSYDHGRYNLEARRLKFLGEEQVDGSVAFRLSLPKIYQVTGRRKLVRHRIPSGMLCSVLAIKKERKSVRKLKGILFDIHAEGFCFVAPASGVTFEKGDQIKLDLETKKEHFKTIHTIVSILSKTQYRRVEGSKQQQIYYGCGVLNVNDAHLLALYVDEIKHKETEVRKASKTSDLTQQLFGKIKRKKHH